MTDSEAAAGNRDKLTTAASLRKSITTSQVLVWQGKMLDDSIIGTFGWRKDINKSWAHDSSVSANAKLPNGNPNPDYKQIDFNSYQLPITPSGRVEVQSRSLSLVAHLMDLPGLKKLTKDLPFEVSLSYNSSTNFKPDASRVDIVGASIPSPSGKTIDRGVQIETRDGRYSLKVNRYVTSVQNATSAGSYQFGYDVGNFFGHGAIYANVFQYDIGNWEWSKSPSNYQVWNNAANNNIRPRYDYVDVNGNVTAATKAEEAAAIAGYRAFQNAVDPRFWAAWGYQSLAYVQSGQPIDTVPSGGTVHVPAGFAVTEDSVSKGWEIELNAEPIRHWRLSLNATKSEAIRTNIGGENLKKLMDLISTAMEGPAGQLHFWWGTPDVPRARDGWYNYNNNPGAQWVSRKLLEGSNVPELRKWHVNLVSNYDITTGFLKGVNYGGGMRFESSDIIGYPPLGDPKNPADYSVDLAHPYRGPSQTNFDLWVGYSRKITKDINWHIQFNVQNAFEGNGLIPITVQGPIVGQAAGTPAAYRIAPAERFTLTNRIEF